MTGRLATGAQLGRAIRRREWPRRRSARGSRRRAVLSARGFVCVEIRSASHIRPSSWRRSSPRAAVERKWRSSDEPTFAIVEYQSDRFLGVVTIRLREGGSLGFWLTRAARGKGVMTHAVKAVVEWARDKHGIRRLYITAHPDNVASQRVAEKAGFVRAGMTPHKPPFRDGTSKAVRFELA